MIDLTVQNIYLEQIQSGEKSVEGRLAKPKYINLAPGDKISFNGTLEVTITKVTRYKSFMQMIQSEGIERVLPGVTSLKEGVAVYRQFYSEEDEKTYGVAAITITKDT